MAISLKKWPKETQTLRKLVEEYVLPLFSGARLYDHKNSNSREQLVSSGPGYKTLLVKLNRDDPYRLVITRAQPFEPGDKELLELIIEEFSIIEHLEIDNVYKDKLYLNALERAISKSITSGSSEVLSILINKLSSWSERTYEGGRVSYGFIVDFDKTSTISSSLHYHLKIDNVLSHDFSAMLSDGVHSWVELDSEGIVVEHVEASATVDQSIFCPIRFGSFAESTSDTRIGIILLSNGELLLIKNKELKFAKRRGSWRSFHHNATLKQMTGNSSYTIPEINKAIYLTALDVSFGRSGGCICYTRKSSLKTLASDKVIDDDDKISLAKSSKSVTVGTIVNGMQFQLLSRKLRQELMGIDGATIIDNDGNLIASGAIISIPGGSSGGGRLAATKALSKYGVSIKISEDGKIQGFLNKKTLYNPNGTDVEIFTIA